MRSSVAIEASAASMGFEHGQIWQEDCQVRRWGHPVRRWELLLVLDAKTAYAKRSSAVLR